MWIKRIDLYNKSRMTGDCHVRFCERLRVKLPLPTRPGDRSQKRAGTWYPGCIRFQSDAFLVPIGVGITPLVLDSIALRNKIKAKRKNRVGAKQM